MQTEHPCGNYNFDTPYWKQSQYNASKPPNDHAYGEESWQLIRDWITSGVNSYNAWNMVLDTVGKSLDNWPQDALLVVDRSAKTLTATPAYYAFRHFSAYVVPGATRIGTTGTHRRGRLQEPRRQRNRGGLQQGLGGGDDDRRGRQRAVADPVPVQRARPRLGDPQGHALR